MWTHGHRWWGFCWLRKLWLRELLVKDILWPDDAERCIAVGVDGVILGVNSTQPSRHSAASLIAGRISAPILIDSGYRRGTNIVKAWALGANAVHSGEQASMALQRLVRPASTTSFTCSRKKSSDRYRGCGPSALARLCHG